MTGHLTPAQELRLRALCKNYNVTFDPEHYKPAFDLPWGWVAGWIGGPGYNGLTENKSTIYVGVSPEGESHS